ITSAAHPDANIIWGAAFDETLKDEMCVTVIATGFEAVPGIMPISPSQTAKTAQGAVSTGFNGVPIAFSDDKVAEASLEDERKRLEEEKKKEEEEDNSFYDDVITLLNNRSK
ncbi:MAG: cell division protein FtsZ, partial [Oscillospiraceae bacterium]